MSNYIPKSRGKVILPGGYKPAVKKEKKPKIPDGTRYKFRKELVTNAGDRLQFSKLLSPEFVILYELNRIIRGTEPLNVQTDMIELFYSTYQRRVKEARVRDIPLDLTEREFEICDKVLGAFNKSISVCECRDKNRHTFVCDPVSRRAGLAPYMPGRVFDAPLTAPFEEYHPLISLTTL